MTTAVPAIKRMIKAKKDEIGKFEREHGRRRQVPRSPYRHDGSISNWITERDLEVYGREIQIPKHLVVSVGNGYERVFSEEDLNQLEILKGQLETLIQNLKNTVESEYKAAMAPKTPSARTTPKPVKDQKGKTKVPSKKKLIEKLKSSPEPAALEIASIMEAKYGGARRQEPAADELECRTGIQINNRRLNELSDESLAEVVASNDPPVVFVRAGSLVRLHQNESFAIELMSASYMKEVLARASRFYILQQSGKETIEVDVSPTGELAQNILSMQQWLGLPKIKGIIETPVIRPDGSTLIKPGYDEPTSLYLNPIMDLDGLDMPDDLTQEHAKAAARYILDEIFADFPFENEASRTNTLATLLSVIVRPMIKGNIPLTIIDKPQAGTGASLIVDLISKITVGREANMWGAPETEDEWRKAITGALVVGSPIIVIDNVVGRLKSASLTRALTAKIWADRQLGQNKMLHLPQESVWIATGNNIQIGGDIARRAIWVRLDANCARPWTRTGFKHPDILGWVEENHRSVITYLLIIARAWVLAGKPKGSAHLGGFTEWAKTISGILEFASVSDFMGNSTQLYDLMDQDVQQWDIFLGEWYAVHGSNPISAKTLMDELSPGSSQIHSNLKEAMPEDVQKAIQQGVRGNPLKLGHVLKGHLNQVYPSGRKLTHEIDKHKGIALWWVEKKPASSGIEDKPKKPNQQHPPKSAGMQGLVPNAGKNETLLSHSGVAGNQEGWLGNPATPAEVATDAEQPKTIPAEPDDIDNLEKIKADQHLTASGAKSEPRRKDEKSTDWLKVSMLKEYRTQVPTDNPSKFEDHTFKVGEVIEVPRYKLKDLVQRGIVAEVTA